MFLNDPSYHPIHKVFPSVCQSWKKVDAADAPPVLIFKSCDNFCFFHAVFAFFCAIFGIFTHFCKILNIFYTYFV